ncbi:hypothetical protein L1D34_07300 [Vibrio mediterranei]|uniref:hypothetical protein n=1 Tax=Vibrio mediterranei TaxID=689 RepID=UPI001EFC738D|nr:hypothetical protein [Vibrio mediterranei]MCG9624645.1 hypothetical protein [Vibrio mediterranei]
MRLLYAVRLDWIDGWVRLHTGIGKFHHFPFDMGERFLGVGSLGGIGDIQYGNGDDTTPSVTLELSVRDETMLASVLAGGYQGRTGELYLVAMGKHGDVLASSMQFDGVMDSATLKQGTANVIQLPLTAPDDAFNQGLNWRCTLDSHLAREPGDNFYKYAVHMADFKTYWAYKENGIPLRDL